jgi:hypothetical protein
MPVQTVEFFKFLSSAKSAPYYNSALDYRADLSGTQRILGHRLQMYKDIGQIVLDTDASAIAVLNLPDWRARSYFRSMAHSVADMDWIANFMASSTCDRVEFASKPCDPDSSMRHPKLDEPKPIDPKLKTVWGHYLSWERTWNQFSDMILSDKCIRDEAVGRIDANTAPNALAEGGSFVTIGEEENMAKLVQVGCRARKVHTIGIVEESLCLAALGLAALVVVSSSYKNESHSTL